nr:PREDICTED: cytochrome P450 4C1-like [Bemisia tabaci]
MIVIVILAVLSLIIISKLITKATLIIRQYQLLKKVPGPPIDSIFLGHAAEILSSSSELPKILGRRVKEYGGFFRLWIFSQPYILLASADYTEMFFSMKELSMKANVYDFLHIWLGLGLLTSQGQLWQQRRKLITPAFHFAMLNNFSETLIDNTVALIKKLREESSDAINVFKMMHLIALDNICETAMGIKIDALNNPKLDYIRAIEDSTHSLMNRMLKPWLWNDTTYFLAPVGRKLKKDLSIIFELTNKVIKERREEKSREKISGDFNANESQTCDDTGGKKKLAFLDLLMEACDSQSVPLSDKDLSDEVNTFMFEGHDTTAVALSYTLFLLGLHPEIQEKCFEELEEMFRGSARKPTPDDLQNMKYLERVIKETLRLCPSVPMICRQVPKDTNLGGYMVPEGSLVTLDVFHLHRDPKYFPEPEKFDPDRFTIENSQDRHPFAYVPFAAGTRNCIGQKFAMMEEKIVLSYILRNFRLESIEKFQDMEPAFELILRSEIDLNVKFISR